MIVRMWHGWTLPANADAYEALLKDEIFVGIQNRHIRGFRGIQLLRRDARGEVGGRRGGARSHASGRAETMTTLMSACGVLCSACPAYLGAAKGPVHQRRTVEAWHRIYGLEERPAHITCGGCLAGDEEVFHTSRTCKARLCCRSKGLASCAECPMDSCPDLERAQSVWDGVPDLARTLSPADAAEYAQPYCGHRQRLSAARRKGSG